MDIAFLSVYKVEAAQRDPPLRRLSRVIGTTCSGRTKTRSILERTNGANTVLIFRSIISSSSWIASSSLIASANIPLGLPRLGPLVILDRRRQSYVAHVLRHECASKRVGRLFVPITSSCGLIVVPLEFQIIGSICRRYVVCRMSVFWNARGIRS